MVRNFTGNMLSAASSSSLVLVSLLYYTLPYGPISQFAAGLPDYRDPKLNLSRIGYPYVLALEEGG